jgi:hypothetical protein
MKSREKIINLIDSQELSKEEKEYLREEIEYFDSQGDFWDKIEKEKIDKSNPNNILIFYLLGIADKPNKLQHSYLMSDPPDIDVDLESEGRDNVIGYLKSKYGENRVLQIGTIGTIKVRSAIIDIARVLDIDPSDVYEVTTSLEKLDEKMSLDEMKSTYPKLKRFLREYPEIETHLSNLIGTYRHYCLSGDSLINCTDILGEVKIPIKELFKDKKRYFLAYINESGNKKFTNDYLVFNLGKQKIYEIELENGKTLKCTKEHLWFTNQGLKKIEEFDKETKILSYE